MNVRTASISELQEHLASNPDKLQQLLDEFLAIAEDRAELNCFISLDKEAITKQCQAYQPNSSHALSGVPVAIKDMLLVEGQAVTAGSKILDGYIPPYSATAVKKLQDAGAILFGKTNMDEFAMGSSNENSAYGAVKNPWDLSRVPGGSSGGSAAAVAAGICPAALGTDTGGSIRQPASFCGIVGVKPTYGRVSRYGVIAFASSLDQVGVFARSVSDCAQVLETICGHDPQDATSFDTPPPMLMEHLGDSIKGLRIGVPKEYFISELDSTIASAIQKAIADLEAQGARIVDISLPHTKYAIPTYYIIAPAEASSNLSRYDGIRYGARDEAANTLEEVYCNTRSSGFGTEVQRRILLGTFVLSQGYYDAYYRKAQRVRTLIAQDFSKAFSESCDIIACPTSPTTAFKAGEKTADPIAMYLNDIFTVPASLAGLPAISVPCGKDPQGLPIGLQLIANAWQEERLFQAAYSFEQANDWNAHLP